MTHHAVREQDYAGSTPAAIRRVLTRFTVADCISFFKDLGVELKQEDTGKLFPTTDDANEHFIQERFIRLYNAKPIGYFRRVGRVDDGNSLENCRM